ncbi:hypothetical protein [Miltoncostaea oceani]|uniref:hypothetical protein n=1 Tax=Miltoncostaea oceani TaxID=2843216 RepID=UPI001C3DE0A8|nr:hypothetical protein [Miltoncostaea oceani]
MPTETVAEQPVAPVPTAPDEPAVVVPDPRPGNEPSPPRATPAEPEPPAPAPRPARPRPRVISSVADLFPTGRPVVEFRTVSWPDRERVAENAVVAGQAILSSNGRNAAALVKILRPRMAPNTLKSFRDLAANGDAAPKGVTLKVKILSASLQRDPQTGARSALLVYQRGADRDPATGVLRLEFAPNESVVTNFSISPLQSGSAP